MYACWFKISSGKCYPIEVQFETKSVTTTISKIHDFWFHQFMLVLVTELELKRVIASDTTQTEQYCYFARIKHIHTQSQRANFHWIYNIYSKFHWWPRTDNIIKPQFNVQMTANDFEWYDWYSCEWFWVARIDYSTFPSSEIQ